MLPERDRPASARRHRGCRFRLARIDNLVSAAIGRRQEGGYDICLVHPVENGMGAMTKREAAA